MQHFPEYLGLLSATFPSTTVSLFQSEVILFGMRMAEHYHVVLLVVVTSDRNILGLCVNRFLGRFIADFENYRWIPLSKS
jgi:membrane protein YqaA with SNARE-associated domain